MPTLIDSENFNDDDKNSFHGYYQEDYQSLKQDEPLESDLSKIDSKNGNYICKDRSRINAKDGTYICNGANTVDLESDSKEFDELPPKKSIKSTIFEKASQSVSKKNPKRKPKTYLFDKSSQPLKKQKKNDDLEKLLSSPKTVRGEDGTYHLDLANINLLNRYGAITNDKLSKYTEIEDNIAKRIQDGQSIYRELLKFRDDFTKRKKTVSLDQYADLIERYQNKHFPDICEQNKGVISEDQNPFPNGFNIEEVSQDTLDFITDTIASLIEQDQTKLTHLSRDLKSLMESYYLVSMMAADRAGKRSEIDTMTQNMGKA